MRQVRKTFVCDEGSFNIQELLFFLESETPSSSKAIRETTFHNKPSQGAKKEHADSHGAVALHMAALNGEASLVVARASICYGSSPSFHRLHAQGIMVLKPRKAALVNRMSIGTMPRIS